MAVQRLRLASQSPSMRLFSRLSLIFSLWLGAAHSGLFAFIASGAAPAGARNKSPATLEAGTTMERPVVASEWRLGVGKAIDVLRRDKVGLFGSGQYTPDFSIYSPDIEVVDARLPSFQVKGIATYEQVLSTLQWSVKTTCDRSQLEITSVAPPVNNEMYMRWRLKLWFKDVRSFLAPALGNPLPQITGGPFIVEGYSRYTFDPWSAEIVKHTIDITNPPMYLQDLFWKYARAPTWMMTPVGSGLGVPTAFVGTPLGFKDSDGQEASTLTGATSPSARSEGRETGRTSSAGLSGWLPGLPQGCEDDFECNDGKANFPLQCCELPVVGKFCCEPPDDYEQGMPRMPAWLPLPVPVEEPFNPGRK